MSAVVTYAIAVLICAVASMVLDPMSQTLREEGAPEAVAVIPLVMSITFFLWMLYFVFRMLQATRREK